MYPVFADPWPQLIGRLDITRPIGFRTPGADRRRSARAVRPAWSSSWPAAAAGAASGSGRRSGGGEAYGFSSVAVLDSDAASQPRNVRGPRYTVSRTAHRLGARICGRAADQVAITPSPRIEVLRGASLRRRELPRDVQAARRVLRLSPRPLDGAVVADRDRSPNAVSTAPPPCEPPGRALTTAWRKHRFMSSIMSHARR